LWGRNIWLIVGKQHLFPNSGHTSWFSQGFPLCFSRDPGQWDQDMRLEHSKSSEPRDLTENEMVLLGGLVEIGHFHWFELRRHWVCSGQSAMDSGQAQAWSLSLAPDDIYILM
jgi:hypothetical protein